MIIRIPDGFSADDLPRVLEKIGEIVQFMNADQVGPTVIHIPLKAKQLELDLFADGNHHAVDIRKVGMTWRAFTDGAPGTLPNGFRVSSAARYFGPTRPKIGENTAPWDIEVL